jgi:hypothetical protein
MHLSGKTAQRVINPALSLLLLMSLTAIAATSAQAGSSCNVPSFYAAPAIFGGGTTRAAAAGDFNNDGKTDLATTTDTGVSILLNNGAMSFSAPANIATGSDPFAVETRDLNNDGKLDLTVFRPGTTIWYALRSTDGGSIRAAMGREHSLPVESAFIH